MFLVVDSILGKEEDAGSENVGLMTYKVNRKALC